MPLLVLRPRARFRPLTALEADLLAALSDVSSLSPRSFPVEAGAPITRADARHALSALWRRGLLTRAGWGDATTYRRKS